MVTNQNLYDKEEIRSIAKIGVVKSTSYEEDRGVSPADDPRHSNWLICYLNGIQRANLYVCSDAS